MIMYLIMILYTTVNGFLYNMYIVLERFQKVYTSEDSNYHYNYVPGNAGKWSGDEGCGSYQQHKYTCNEDTYHIY